MIFVFGSNLSGIHGRGAALTARQQHGAVYGVGRGMSGNSYAIPTRRFVRPGLFNTLLLADIKGYVDEFIAFAKAHPELEFNVTRIGCGLAGYAEEQIAPMFEDAPINCHLPGGWR